MYLSADHVLNLRVVHGVGRIVCRAGVGCFKAVIVCAGEMLVERVPGSVVALFFTPFFTW